MCGCVCVCVWEAGEVADIMVEARSGILFSMIRFVLLVKSERSSFPAFTSTSPIFLPPSSLVSGPNPVGVGV